MDERRTRRARIGDAALAVSFAALSIIAASNIEREPDERWNAFGVVLVLVISAALLLRSTAPLASLSVIVAGLVGYTLLDYPGGPVYLAALVPMYTLASTRGWRQAATPTAVAIVVLVASGLTREGSPSNLGYHIAFVGWSGAAVFLGESARNRRAYLAELEQRARDLEETREEEARRRVAEERLRIARDLHDVIAHGIATIHLQSGVAAHVLERRPDEVAPALLAIKQTSKQVLSELRSTLDVLRAGEEDAPLAPTPGLGRLDELVEATRRAGITVELHRDGGLTAPLPTAVDTAVYRIVQESLTNVMRHAGGARAEVTVVRTGDEVQIEVADDGVGVPANGNGSRPGHGIVGMRERAEILGGRLDAGPRPGGGFRVRAWLPVAAASS